VTTKSVLLDLARAAGLLLFGVTCLFVVFVNVDAITEAYGSGPPYYDRTTNMDKWADPLPVLFAIDLAMALIAALIVRAYRRRT